MKHVTWSTMLVAVVVTAAATLSSFAAAPKGGAQAGAPGAGKQPGGEQSRKGAKGGSSEAARNADAAVWRGKVGSAVRNPKLARQIMSELKTQEGKADFVAALNRAVEALPDSPDRKAAFSLAVNTAVVAGAGRSDRLAVVAEVFATASCESLTVISEQFGKNLFSRDSANQMTDAEYKALAETAMGTISERCDTADSSAVRETMAVLMFDAATSSSSPEFKKELTHTLVQALPVEKREVAEKTWIPAAQGEGQSQSYEAVLSEVSGAEAPDASAVTAQAAEISAGRVDATVANAENGGNFEAHVVLQETSQQMTDSMLADLTADHTYETEPALNTVGVVGQTTGTASGAAGGAVAGSAAATPGASQGASGTSTVPRDWVDNPVTPDGKVNPHYSPTTHREPIYYEGQIIGYKDVVDAIVGGN